MLFICHIGEERVSFFISCVGQGITFAAVDHLSLNPMGDLVLVYVESLGFAWKGVIFNILSWVELENLSASMVLGALTSCFTINNCCFSKKSIKTLYSEEFILF